MDHYGGRQVEYVPAAALGVLRGGTIELFTSRYQNKELADLSCQPVGISRGTPRFRTGYSYRLMRELAPSREAFAIKDQNTFAEAYRAGLEEIGLEAIMGKLAKISEEAGGLPLCLLCYEDLSQPDQWCHRTVLSAWLRENGVQIKELEGGDLPRRPDAPQPPLF